MNSCVRRKFLGKLGKRVLEILGVIVGFCFFVAILFVISKWADAQKYAGAIVAICFSGIFILLVITSAVVLRDWYKDTLRLCKRECKYEERDANTSR